MQPHRDNIPLPKSLLIAVRRLYPAGLALSVTCGDTYPKGRGPLNLLIAPSAAV